MIMKKADFSAVKGELQPTLAGGCVHPPHSRAVIKQVARYKQCKTGQHAATNVGWGKQSHTESQMTPSYRCNAL